jgi:phosphoglycerate dehydrogenase-like enzyme
MVGESHRVAILDDYQGVAQGFADWDSLGSSVAVTVFRDTLADEDALAARLAPFDIIVAMRERTRFTRQLLERLPKLRLLSTTGMRNAAIDIAAARERGVVVSGTEGVAHPTAELAWALVLALARNLVSEERSMRAGGWQTTVGTGLRGKTLGVVGLGRLGAQVARFGLAFGMKVLAWSQNLDEKRCAEVGAEYASKERLFAEADFVTIHLVLSQRTRGLVGGGDLARMKKSAYLVNTSRGPIVEETALVAALEEGRIAGAALDVYDEEPLPADHPLRRTPNLVLTPHLGYVTDDTYRVFYGQSLDNVAAFLAGKPVRVLNP